MTRAEAEAMGAAGEGKAADQPPLLILYAGDAHGTCKQRARALGELGHQVDTIEMGVPQGWLPFQLYRVVKKLGRPPDVIGAGRKILRALRERPYDVLWVDKGLTLDPKVLRMAARIRPRAVSVHYSPDDMFNPVNQSPQYLQSVPLYDLHVTTKSYNVAELMDAGARDVFFVDNAYDPGTHRPLALSETDLSRYGCDVGFIGGYEENRALQVRRLAEEGVRVTVWGTEWTFLRTVHPRLVIHGELLDGLDYAKAINATRINLGFLRKVNRDLQTTRSIEIPACGGFLLAERTGEHLRLFEEGKEAEFFDSFEELLRKVRHYLEKEEERKTIAQAGRARCLASGYSNHARMGKVIDEALRIARGNRVSSGRVGAERSPI